MEDIRTIKVNDNENINVIEVNDNENIFPVALRDLLKGEKGDPGTTDYNELKNIPQIKIFNELDDEKIIDIKGIKTIQELGIAPFILLDMSVYTSSNPLTANSEIMDGTYMTLNLGNIETSEGIISIENNSILIKHEKNLTIVCNLGNYYYYVNNDVYEGGYAVTNADVETLLASYQKTKEIHIITRSSTITLNNGLWYQKNSGNISNKLTQVIPNVIDTYYECKVSLNIGPTLFENIMQNNSDYELKFIGLDCENGEWNPRMNMRYNLDYYFDGVYIVCNVTGFERS